MWGSQTSFQFCQSLIDQKITDSRPFTFDIVLDFNFLAKRGYDEDFAAAFRRGMFDAALHRVVRSLTHTTFSSLKECV